MEIRIKDRLTYIALGLIAFGVVMRLVPHADNFAPVGAIALFGGVVLPRKLAWWLPVAIMALSDLFIGFYDSVVFTWLAFLLVGLYGMSLRNATNWFRVPAGALGAALIFFVVSNFGVWLLGGMYTHTWVGLVQCYEMALPFLRNTLLGDLAYSTFLFGVYALVTHQKAALATHKN